MESGGAAASVVGKGGLSTQSVCHAATTIMPPLSAFERGVGWGPRGSICICSHSAILVDPRASLSHLGVILEAWAAVLLLLVGANVSFLYIMFEECEG